MESKKLAFLQAVLGGDGAVALKKAAERCEELGEALVPRTVLAWLSIASRFDFDGEIPGQADTVLTFKKTEQDSFVGDITIGDTVYNFNNATLYHLAASIAVALGVDQEKAQNRIKDIDLVRLGKNIDLLAKSAYVHTQTKKIELPGQAAKPQQPVEPGAPNPPEMQGEKGPGKKQAKLPSGTPKPKLPRVPRAKQSIKVAKSLRDVKCRICGLGQFEKLKFIGCTCFRALNKSVKTTDLGTELKLEFGSEWDKDSILTLLETLRK